MDNPDLGYIMVTDWSIVQTKGGGQVLNGMNGKDPVETAWIKEFISKSEPKSALISGDVIIAGGLQYMLDGKAKGQA